MTRLNNIDEHDPLLKRARALPKVLPPSQDLWPDIEARLNTPQSMRWSVPRLAAAAVILMAITSTFTVWLTKEFTTPANLLKATTLPVAEFGPWVANGADIVQARTAMLLSVQNELAELSPATWEILTTNLYNIEVARQEITAALHKHPNSELLQHLLLASYTNEFTVLTRVGGMTRTAQQRTSL